MNPFIPRDIVEMFQSEFEGQCWKQLQIGGGTWYMPADFQTYCAQPKFIDYQQMLDFLERQGIDISRQFLRKMKKHTYLFFFQYNGETQWVNNLHVSAGDKWLGYDEAFKLAYKILKNPDAFGTNRA